MLAGSKVGVDGARPARPLPPAGETAFRGVPPSARSEPRSKRSSPGLQVVRSAPVSAVPGVRSAASATRCGLGRPRWVAAWPPYRCSENAASNCSDTPVPLPWLVRPVQGTADRSPDHAHDEHERLRGASQSLLLVRQLPRMERASGHQLRHRAAAEGRVWLSHPSSASSMHRTDGITGVHPPPSPGPLAHGMSAGQPRRQALHAGSPLQIVVLAQMAYCLRCRSSDVGWPLTCANAGFQAA